MEDIPNVSHQVYRLNKESAELAKKAAREVELASGEINYFFILKSCYNIQTSDVKYNGTRGIIRQSCHDFFFTT